MLWIHPFRTDDAAGRVVEDRVAEFGHGGDIREELAAGLAHHREHAPLARFHLSHPLAHIVVDRVDLAAKHGLCGGGTSVEVDDAYVHASRSFGVENRQM